MHEQMFQIRHRLYLFGDLLRYLNRPNKMKLIHNTPNDKGQYEMIIPSSDIIIIILLPTICEYC